MYYTIMQDKTKRRLNKLSHHPLPMPTHPDHEDDPYRKLKLQPQLQERRSFRLLITLLSATVVQLVLALSFAPFSRPVLASQLDLAPGKPLNASGLLSTAAVTDTATATATATSQITNSLPLTDVNSVINAITNTLALTLPSPISNTLLLTPTPAAPISETQPLTNTDAISNSPVLSETIDESTYSSIISGTIIANRTEQQALFFVEGATYLLDPLRSIGLQLPRGTAAVNLFNCDARTTQTEGDCFWDPYLLKADGFYEIVSGSDAGKVVSLVLREVGTPATDKVFIQNRTGKSETVYVGGQEISIAPASVHEFQVQPDTPVLIYMQSCVTVENQEACEWAPRTAQPGSYYALVETSSTGSASNSQLISLELQEVLISGGEPTIAAPPQVTCTTLVPSLNVRSGPGLQYTIIQKVRINGNEPAQIIVIGRDQDNQWLAVDERIAPGGWVIASSDFVRCEGDIAALPVTQPSVAQLQPTPAQPQAQAQNQTQAPSTDSGATSQPPPEPTAQPEQTTTEATPAAIGVPEGYALITINNGFDKQVRFTLDQQYRRDLGPSEFDLEPGGSVQIVVIPGQFAFSVSSPWSGLSGSADIFLDKDQSRVLWVTFVLDSGEWVLRF